jgi:hypothetical protein
MVNAVFVLESPKICCDAIPDKEAKSKIMNQ